MLGSGAVEFASSRAEAAPNLRTHVFDASWAHYFGLSPKFPPGVNAMHAASLAGLLLAAAAVLPGSAEVAEVCDAQECIQT